MSLPIPGTILTTVAAATFKVPSQVIAMGTGKCEMSDVSTAGYKCRRTAACGVHALETVSGRHACSNDVLWCLLRAGPCTEPTLTKVYTGAFWSQRIISANHSRHCKPSSSRRCDAVPLGQQLPTFRRIILSSSWDSSESSSTVWHWGEGRTIFRNVGN
jgi:hypothetical protein